MPDYFIVQYFMLYLHCVNIQSNMKTKQNSNLSKTIDIDKIRALRNRGMTIQEMANELSCSSSTVTRLVKKYGLQVHRRWLSGNNHVLKNQIESLLNDGLTVHKICQILHLNSVGYFKVMGKDFAKTPKQFKNKVSEKFLDLSNPAFCYFLGLFIADGHIDNDIVYIGQCDASFLHKLQSIMGHTGNLIKSTNGKNPCYTLRILRSQIYPVIESYKIPSNKKLSAPYIDCGELEPHFIRGLFDGDGCLYYAYISGKLKNKMLSISTGSPAIRDGVVRFLTKHGIESTVSETRSVHTCYSVSVSKIDDILKFGHLIYANKGNAFLDRKYVSFIKFEHLVNMNNEVNEIVDTTGKLVE